MKLYAGTYITHDSSYIIKVLKVSYQNDTYAKIKAELYDKKSGYLCENKRKYKVYKSFITHWKKYDYKNI